MRAFKNEKTELGMCSYITQTARLATAKIKAWLCHQMRGTGVGTSIPEQKESRCH